VDATIRILYAEDNSQDADQTRFRFAEDAPEFEIEIADTGQGCLARLSETEFDLLLLDHHLPDMDGLDVLRTLVHAGVQVPVVMVTGVGDEDLVVKALRLGAANYVPKQGNYLETLAHVVRDALVSHRARQRQGLLAASTPRRILYVEHQTMDIELTLRHFAEDAPHFTVDVVHTSAEALVRLGQPHEYDLALIDLRMPDLSGLDFASEAKRRGLRLPPFIMISGKGDDAAAIATLNLGAADYVAKGEGYLDKLVYAIDQAIAFDRINSLNERLQAELAERKQAEAQLALAAAQWRQTFDAMSDSVALFDAEGRVLRCNAATTALTGLDFEEIVGRRCFEVFHASSAYQLDCPQLRALASGQTETSLIEQHDRWLRVTFQPLVDEAGRVCSGVHVVSDVSELKRAEAGLLASLATQQTITAGVIAALARSVEVRDPYTAGHQRRVGELAAAMALQIGLGEERAQGLRVAGMLHDVGKLNIPAEILSKPAQLTVIEFELIKSHARAGFEILAAIRFPWPVAETALQHHERLDGSGYPAGLVGDQILPEARILAVADVVEAMASHRPYRPALGLEAALAEVHTGGGSRYDADAVAACERAFAQGFVFSEA
jgi:PAS domain S-box-containing protein/putative nucleotidyltransferase with HDIG domain